MIEWWRRGAREYSISIYTSINSLPLDNAVNNSDGVGDLKSVIYTLSISPQHSTQANKGYSWERDAMCGLRAAAVGDDGDAPHAKEPNPRKSAQRVWFARNQTVCQTHTQGCNLALFCIKIFFFCFFKVRTLMIPFFSTRFYYFVYFFFL